MRFGYFDEKNREYVITNPATPSPWINYLGSDQYCALISNNAGGYSFYLSAKTGRFMRFRYNNLPADRPGRYLYLRDKEHADYWSLSWQPVGKDLTGFKTETRHGLGYTIINSLYDSIQSRVCYFVPIGENIELWWVTIKNLRPHRALLSLFSYVEFAVWEALADLTDYQYFLNIVRASALADKGLINFDVGTNLSLGRPSAFAFSSETPEAYDCDRDIFIGNYHSEANPQAVCEGKCFNSQAKGGNACAVFQIELSLESQEEKALIFGVGVGQAKEEGLSFKAKYSQLCNVEMSFLNLKEHWQKKLAVLQVDTSSSIFNQTINTLNPYQAHTTFNWSRSASYYESGTFRDGLGFRDSNQDALAVIPAEPERVRLRILNLARAISLKGAAAHIYQPLSGEATGGTDYSDDHLWPVLTTASYIRETGDLAVLNEKIPWLDSKSQSSLWEHLKRAIDYALGQRGAHGLCLALKADWDDTLNLSQGGESVWTTELLILALNEFQALACLRGEKGLARKYKAPKQFLCQAIQKFAWDGDWFLRAYTGSGRKVGSKENPEGTIFLNPNTWAVICGVASREQGLRAMDAVRSRLNTPFGLMALGPAYKSYDSELGTISLYPPSLKENGAVFCHTNPWAVIAECMLGRGDLAFEYFNKLCPLAMNEQAEVRKTEPYVFSQFLAGLEHLRPGEARNSWLTGTASWSYVAGAQYILGIKPTYYGLCLDPCLPQTWDGFKAKRLFRGALYEICVKNPSHVSYGIKTLKLNRERLAGNLIPLQPAGAVCQVEAEMG